MKEQTIKQQWRTLIKVRGWLLDGLSRSAASDPEIRHCLFEAEQAIGFALLQI